MIIQLFDTTGPSVEAPANADQRVAATLAIMGEMVKLSRSVDVFRNHSRYIFGLDAQKAAVLAFEWLKAWTVFQEDPAGVELIRAPWEMHDRITKTQRAQPGDCDDRATLIAAMLHCAGHDVGFVVVTRQSAPKPFRHVLACIFTPDGQHVIPIDPQHAREPGMLPDGVERQGYYRIV